MLLIINEDPIKEKHVCFYTEDWGEKIKLIEVVLAKYRHPQALDYAVIEQFEIRYIKEIKRIHREKVAEVELMESIQNTVFKLQKEKS